MKSSAAVPLVSPRVPTPFLVLGAGGLLPFVAGAFAAWWAPPGDNSEALHWMLGYGMVILSFVGALHWGVAMARPAADEATRWIAAGWSVLPALAAWGAFAMPTVHGLQLIAAMFVAQLAMDRWLVRAYAMPPWFWRMRLALTAVVIASIAVALFAYYRYFG